MRRCFPVLTGPCHLQNPPAVEVPAVVPVVPWVPDGGTVCGPAPDHTAPPPACASINRVCRQTLWKDLVRILVEEVGCQCQVCGLKASSWDESYPMKRRNRWAMRRVMTLDHIVPRQAGGAGHRDNLWVLCMVCNQQKAHTPPEEWANTLSTEVQEKFRPLLARARAYTGADWIVYTPNPCPQRAFRATGSAAGARTP